MGATVTVDELDALIETIGKCGYMWYRFRDNRHGPQVVAGVYHWPTCADVLVLIDNRDTHAYRTPTPAADVFAPALVHWWYGRSEDIGMVWVLRSLLTLPRPHHPGGLPPAMPAPPGTGVPGDRVPVRMRRWHGR